MVKILKFSLKKVQKINNISFAKTFNKCLGPQYLSAEKFMGLKYVQNTLKIPTYLFLWLHKWSEKRCRLVKIKNIWRKIFSIITWFWLYIGFGYTCFQYAFAKQYEKEPWFPNLLPFHYMHLAWMILSIWGVLIHLHTMLTVEHSLVSSFNHMITFKHANESKPRIPLNFFLF